MTNSPYNFYFRLKLGDIVTVNKTGEAGLIVDQSYRFTTSNRYLVQIEEIKQWLGEDSLTLFSGIGNRT